MPHGVPEADQGNAGGKREQPFVLRHDTGQDGGDAAEGKENRRPPREDVGAEQRDAEDEATGEVRCAVDKDGDLDQADASGVKMVGHANGLISALEKLGAYNKRIPMDIAPTTSALMIVQPLSGREMFSSLFSTHPPLADRIAALRNMTITREG